jgi:hypothetical protein
MVKKSETKAERLIYSEFLLAAHHPSTSICIKTQKLIQTCFSNKSYFNMSFFRMLQEVLESTKF